MSLDITPLVPDGRQIIHSYGEGGFRVSARQYSGSLIILPERCLGWGVSALAEISRQSLSPLFDGGYRPEILVIGSGAAFTRTPDELARSLGELGVKLEWMATGAACRTYNVLAIEGRNVAAALVAVD